LRYLTEPTKQTIPAHPLGSRARVLLTSVFGPYAQDDEYGSRAINPMELYHNQVTREQGVFSLRMSHRSWGLMLIQANLSAPTTLLDFPTRERFIEELESHPYDVIGISSIIPNIGKAAEMCRLIRKHQPRATIVVGGHVANHPKVAERVDADYIVRGEGVRWFRSFLGEDVEQPIHHPQIVSSIGARTMGVPLSDKPGDTAATLIPSVGCPLGCNFCSTSAMFGGKGRFINFYETGDELFHVMCELEAAMKARSFFVMDENFLLHRKRALRLLELMQANHKPWALYVFSSANTLRRYSIDQLVGLGVSWLWMGLEGKDSEYAKLHGADTRALVRELQEHGIRVLGSSIVGLLEHTPENIEQAIEHAVSHDTEFHQFMLYTPVPGTPLYAEHAAQGTLLGEDQCPDADAHGQLRFNYRHPHIPAGMETAYLERAFRRDFEENGPSVLRIARTLLQGWRRHKNDPDRRVRERYRWECRDLATAYAGAVWAAERWLADKPVVSAKLEALRRELCAEFGLTARLSGPVVGRYVLHALRREERLRREGAPFEPPTFYEHNAAFAAAPRPDPVSVLSPSVAPLPVTQ